MLAYAANRPVVGKASSSPTAMLLIISAHVALIALIMSAKMEFSPKPSKQPPLINIPLNPPPPPPNPTAIPPEHARTQLPISDPAHVVPLPHPDPVPLHRPKPATWSAAAR